MSKWFTALTLIVIAAGSLKAAAATLNEVESQDSSYYLESLTEVKDIYAIDGVSAKLLNGYKLDNNEPFSLILIRDSKTDPQRVRLYDLGGFSRGSVFTVSSCQVTQGSEFQCDASSGQKKYSFTLDLNTVNLKIKVLEEIQK